MLVLTPPIRFLWFCRVSGGRRNGFTSFSFLQSFRCRGCQVLGAARASSGLGTTVRVTVVFVVVVSFRTRPLASYQHRRYRPHPLIALSPFSSPFLPPSASFFSCSNFVSYSATGSFFILQRSNSSNAFCFHRSKSWFGKLRYFLCRFFRFCRVFVVSLRDKEHIFNFLTLLPAGCAPMPVW